MDIKTNKILDTKNKITWCPGCPNYKILDAVKIAMTRLMKQGYKTKDFAMVTGIGCHGKMFDVAQPSGGLEHWGPAVRICKSHALPAHVALHAMDLCPCL